MTGVEVFSPAELNRYKNEYAGSQASERNYQNGPLGNVKRVQRMARPQKYKRPNPEQRLF